MDGWTLSEHGSYRRTVGGFELAVTDQRYRRCGWCWHVSLKDTRFGDGGEAGGGAGADTPEKAQQAAENYIRDFCQRTLGALSPEGQRGGPTEQQPDRPYCKPDQSCCDFTCGN